MKARISQLHKTETGWDRLADFVPQSGELIIYDPDDSYNYARLKVGDGVTKLKDLPFFIDSVIVDIITKHRYDEILDCGRITDYKK